MHGVNVDLLDTLCPGPLKISFENTTIDDDDNDGNDYIVK